MAGAVDLSGLKARASAPEGVPRRASTSPHVVEVSEESFQADVVEASMQTLVVVDLWSARSDTSTQHSALLEKLVAADNGAWLLARVEVDTQPRIAELFGAQSLPTTVAVAAGQPVQAFSGAQPEAQLRSWIDGLISALAEQLPGTKAAAGDRAEAEPLPPDPRFTAAEQALDAGDYDGAVAAYELVLNAEPANLEARSALAQVRFIQRVATVPPDAVAVADAAPDDTDAQLVAADAEVAGQQIEAAFDRLVGLVRRAGAGDTRDAARARLLSLFELFDPAEPFVVAARRKLASALY
ncbi:MAG: tetratricopeptide repeat protein [Mycobacteriaceae bacterium]